MLDAGVKLPPPVYLAGALYREWIARMPDKNVRQICIHESAHAVVGQRHGSRPDSLCLTWRYHASVGYVLWGGKCYGHGDGSPAYCMAGYAADVFIMGLPATGNYTRDVLDADRLLAGTGRTREDAAREAEAILREDWPLVTALAGELQRLGSLGSVEAMILDGRRQIAEQRAASVLAFLDDLPPRRETGQAPT